LRIAQAGGSPFDTGFTSLQNLFTGTIAKVASLIAIVVGGYMFAHGEAGAKPSPFGYVATSQSREPVMKQYFSRTMPRNSAARWEQNLLKP
jgi:hypothetical protein